MSRRARRAAAAAFFDTNATVCAATRCAAPALALSTLPLDLWWSRSWIPPQHDTVRKLCGDCAAASAQPGHRPCSRSAERQESFVLALATAMMDKNNNDNSSRGGGGFFLELGGHNGMHASNTLFSEACKGWRGLLIEANPTSFMRLRIHRPGVLAARGAVCRERGRVTFASRRSVGAAKRGFQRPAVDETGGVESLMGRTFERAGYATTAPTAWLTSSKAYRVEVPCAPLSDYLEPLRVRRIDVFWLDVEGAELQIVQTLPDLLAPAAAATTTSAITTTAAAAIDGASSSWSSSSQQQQPTQRQQPQQHPVSIGILVVEMRFNDATRNAAILKILAALGFELVRALSVWGYQLYDCVFLRAEHFLMTPQQRAMTAAGSTAGVATRPDLRMPAAAMRLLHGQKRNQPPGANMRWEAGRIGGHRYVVREPTHLSECTAWANFSDGKRRITVVKSGQKMSTGTPSPWPEGVAAGSSAADEVVSC